MTDDRFPIRSTGGDPEHRFQYQPGGLVRIWVGDLLISHGDRLVDAVVNWPDLPPEILQDEQAHAEALAQQALVEASLNLGGD